MRKLFFLFTMVLAVSMAMAQNSVNLSQEGAKQEATIDQAGTNSAKVTQFTDNEGPQKSTVLQYGEGNTVVVKQDQTGGGNNTPANTAFIQQVGNNNYGRQIEFAPGYNSGQHVIANQTGNSNDVRQTIFSGYTELLESNQTGHENIVIQEATGGGHNTAGVNQNGMRNWAKQEMFGDNNGYSAAEIYINQLGDYNKARQLFTGIGQGHKNNGTIYQSGAENDAFQEGEGRDLNLKLWQEGINNKSTQKSWGNGNVSWLNQDGNNNTSTIVQSGDENSTKLYQTGDGGKVDVLQEGNSNIIAGLGMAETGSVYSLKARQLGENNELNIDSRGTVTVMQDNTLGDMVGNKINYYQSGVGITKLSQVGDENFIGLSHGGNGNANIKQEGNSNKVGSFANVFAYDPDLEVGSGTFNGEKMNVSQLGASNLLHLSSSGFSDIVTVLQQGNSNVASVTQQ